MCKLGKGAEGRLKALHKPGVREAKHTKTSHISLKRVETGEGGRREIRSTTETRSLRSEENGTNKRPRGITRRRRIGEKLKQSSEQITRNENNTCKGAGFC